MQIAPLNEKSFSGFRLRYNINKSGTVNEIPWTDAWRPVLWPWICFVEGREGGGEGGGGRTSLWEFEYNNNNNECDPTLVHLSFTILFKDRIPKVGHFSFQLK